MLPQNESPLKRGYILLIGLLVVIAIVTHLMIAGGGDKPVFLAYGKMWIEGKRLYNDMFQPNFPMIVWFYGLASFIASHVNADADHIVIIQTLLLVMLSVLLCHRIMRLHPYFLQHKDMVQKHSVAVVMVLVFFANPLFFSDREHLMMALLFPFLIRNMPSLDNAQLTLSLRISCAVMAVLALCFKPHALMLVGGIALLRLWRQRSLQTLFCVEHSVIGVLFVCYLLQIWIYSPEYFTIMLPMASVTYSAMTKGIETLQYYITSGFMLAVILADFRLRHRSPLRSDILYFLAVIVFCLGYILVNNGWIYTFYPINCVVTLLAFWLLWQFTWLAKAGTEKQQNIKQFTFGANACRIVLTVNVLLVLLNCYGTITQALEHPISARDRLYADMTQIIKDKKARSFGTLSATAAFWPRAASESKTYMATRFITLWMLPKLITEGEAFTQKHAWIPEYVANAYAEDFNNKKPEIIFVDAAKNFFGVGPLNLITYFTRYSAFADAWKHYSLLTIIDRCSDPEIQKLQRYEVWCRHEVYVRNDRNSSYKQEHFQ